MNTALSLGKLINNICIESSENIIRDFREIEMLHASRRNAYLFAEQTCQKSTNELFYKLKKVRPGYGIISPYNEYQGTDHRCKFLIKPIDSIINLSRSIPHIVISIIMMHDDIVYCIGCYAPITNDFFYAKKGEGFFINQRKIRIKNKIDSPPYTIVSNTNAIPSCLMTNDYYIYLSGSIKFDLCLLAARKFDIGYFVIKEKYIHNFESFFLLMYESYPQVCIVKKKKENTMSYTIDMR